MDITNVSSALSALQFSDTSSLTQSVSMKMLDNALDMNATMSDGITRMMKRLRKTDDTPAYLPRYSGSKPPEE